MMRLEQKKIIMPFFFFFDSKMSYIATAKIYGPIGMDNTIFVVIFAVAGFPALQGASPYPIPFIFNTEHTEHTKKIYTSRGLKLRV
jgi:hypothetical protein